MTCIVAMKNKKGKIVIGADRRLSTSKYYQKSDYPKVIKNNGVIIAWCGEYALGVLASTIFKVPDKTKQVNSYMFHVFPKALKRLLISRGYGKGDDLILHEQYTEFVVAVHGQAYSVVVENDDPLLGLIRVEPCPLPYCTGSGGFLAWGSILTSEKMAMRTRDKVKLAIQVAAQVDSAVDSNVDIEVED